MGVKTLWFMPITPIAQKNKKGTLGSYYACSDYKSVNPEFGTLPEFKELVRQAHQFGFKVIIDWVANHTGWDHIWTKQHPEWYEKEEATGDFKRAAQMDDIIELDFRNTAMRQAMIDAMIYWVKECDIDGFRCDLAFWVELDFWVEAKKALDQVKPLFWLAEADPLEFPDYMQVFDAAYTWTWMHKTETFYKQNLALHDLLVVLHQYQRVPGIKAWFTSNHDENSWNGTEYEKYGDMAMPLAVFSCTWQGIPLLYSGQELPNIKRLQFFEKDVIEWHESLQLHQFFKALLDLQHRVPALHVHSDVFRVHTSNDKALLCYMRKKEDSEVLVFLNFTNRPVAFDILDGWMHGQFFNLFNGNEQTIAFKSHFMLQPWGYEVFIRKQEQE